MLLIRLSVFDIETTTKHDNNLYKEWMSAIFRYALYTKKPF